MGVAEVIPGISGGTIALLLGIYDRMVAALAQLTIIVKDLATFKWASLQRIGPPLQVMLPLLVGMAIGAGVAIFTIKHLVDSYPIHTFGSIFGIVLAAAVFTFLQSKSRQRLIFIPLGILVSLPIGLLTHSTETPGLWLVYLGAVLAFGAWILPGISGSLVLLILGVWTTMLHAFTTFEVVPICCFGLGIVSGWLVFSQPVRLLLTRYRNGVMGFFTGLLLGSLWKLWPWQLDHQPVLPHQLQEGLSFLVVIVLMLLGFGVVVFLTCVRNNEDIR